MRIHTYRWTQPIIRQLQPESKVELQQRLGELHDRLGVVEVELAALGPVHDALLASGD